MLFFFHSQLVFLWGKNIIVVGFVAARGCVVREQSSRSEERGEDIRTLAKASHVLLLLLREFDRARFAIQ
jgi:hypothetical protein